MAAINMTPVWVADAPTSYTDLYTGPSATEETKVTVRVTNKTAADRTYSLYHTVSADTTQASGVDSVKDFVIPAADARDVEVNLPMSNGYKLRHKADATGLAVRVTGKKRTI